MRIWSLQCKLWSLSTNFDIWKFQFGSFQSKKRVSWAIVRLLPSRPAPAGDSPSTKTPWANSRFVGLVCTLRFPTKLWGIQLDQLLPKNYESHKYLKAFCWSKQEKTVCSNPTCFSPFKITIFACTLLEVNFFPQIWPMFIFGWIF